MKLIENSLGLDNGGSKSDLKDINGVIYELEGEIKVKENQISEYICHHHCQWNGFLIQHFFRLYRQLNNQNYSKDDNSKIEQKLGLLETQMNAKILQMQNKKAKLLKITKSNNDLGGE